jgi:hypothetical protein
MASSSQAVPSQEQLLQLVESHGGAIKDTRELWKSATEKPSWEDEAASEEYFKRRAAWQLSLQGILNSLISREVSIPFPLLEVTRRVLILNGAIVTSLSGR